MTTKQRKRGEGSGVRRHLHRSWRPSGHLRRRHPVPLCEFRTEENDAYGALTDLELTRLFIERTRPGGHLLFYTGSYAYAQAETVITEWAASSPVEEVEGFKTLRVFRKVEAGAVLSGER